MRIYRELLWGASRVWPYLVVVRPFALPHHALLAWGERGGLKMGLAGSRLAEASDWKAAGGVAFTWPCLELPGVEGLLRSLPPLVPAQLMKDSTSCTCLVRLRHFSQDLTVPMRGFRVVSESGITDWWSSTHPPFLGVASSSGLSWAPIGCTIPDNYYISFKESSFIIWILEMFCLLYWGQKTNYTKAEHKGKDQRLTMFLFLNCGCIKTFRIDQDLWNQFEVILYNHIVNDSSWTLCLHGTNSSNLIDWLTEFIPRLSPTNWGSQSGSQMQVHVQVPHEYPRH